jgi:hypothetical protein
MSLINELEKMGNAEHDDLSCAADAARVLQFIKRHSDEKLLMRGSDQELSAWAASLHARLITINRLIS